MILEVTQQVRDGLATLIRHVNDGSVVAAEVRELLRDSKAIAAQVAVLQADAAAVVAASERHPPQPCKGTRPDDSRTATSTGPRRSARPRARFVPNTG